MRGKGKYDGLLAVGFLVLVLAGSAFVGIVKFMAFWRVAFGG